MADDQGFGQQQPTNWAGEYNSQRFIIDQALARISTARLVQVKGVDTAAKTVDVQPLVKQMDGEGNATDHGTIFGIPYMALQFGKNAVVADPVVGDKGLMVVCDRDISAVKANKTFSQPGSSRQFDMSDGLYFGGVMNDDPEQWVKFTDDGMELNAKGNHKLYSTSAGGWMVDKLTITGNLQLGGQVLGVNGGTYADDINTTGDVKAGSISLKSHVHQYLRPASGSNSNTGGPQ